MTETLAWEDVLRVLAQALTDLDGPDPADTRIGIVKRDLYALHFHIRRDLARTPEPPALPDDSLSRIALLFTALVTSDSLLGEAARDVLPPRPYTVMIRTHIENWLRNGSREGTS